MNGEFNIWAFIGAIIGTLIRKVFQLMHKIVTLIIQNIGKKPTQQNKWED